MGKAGQADTKQDTIGEKARKTQTTHDTRQTVYPRHWKRPKGHTHGRYIHPDHINMRKLPDQHNVIVGKLSTSALQQGQTGITEGRVRTHNNNKAAVALCNFMDRMACVGKCQMVPDR